MEETVAFSGNACKATKTSLIFIYVPYFILVRPEKDQTASVV
jgi:hypothetical protein